MALRVVFADDNFLVRQGTAALLGESPDVEVVAVVPDARELMTAVVALAPDAVLTDIRMPPSFTDEGLRAAKEIRRSHPGTGVLVLSQFVEPVEVLDLLSEGVAGLGYLLKDRVTDLDELVGALQTVARGGSALDPLVVEALIAGRTAQDRSPLASLTERELAVLAEMATGKNNQAIARVLRISERAVEKHINALFGKLGAADEPDANRRVLAVLAFLEARPPER
jgi:DNA-binding NarL/FixJ family response regulator